MERALAGLKHPRLDTDVLSAGMIADLAVDEGGGAVTFTFLLAREDPGSLAREVRKAVQAVPGVRGVTVNVKDKQRHLASVAEEYGTYFLELKLLNPEIRKDYLPRGTHRRTARPPGSPGKASTSDSVASDPHIP